MSIGIIGKKVGMTRVYDESGAATAVTVIEASPNVISQLKTVEKDGYKAAQIAFDDVKESRSTKQLVGHYKKANSAPKRIAREFSDIEGELGAKITVSAFQVGQLVDVIGISKGRGFQGVVKRWGFAGQPETHGSMMHRRPGAIGCRNKPGRVFALQKLPGHMGTTKTTVQNLKVLQISENDNLLVIKGAIPGARGSFVIVRNAVKDVKKGDNK
ncbi:MAG: 50S ribosomal protein L3 [Verrucomicrobiales bacterium]|jgi:large subunit ribosomal protein L3|nr:50S ribosomal protein L3 [Verrucomicrobiales bacterium]